MPRPSEVQPPAPVVGIMVTRAIEVLGELPGPGGAGLELRWERCAMEPDAHDAGFLIIAGSRGIELDGTAHRPNGSEGANFAVKDPRAIRALAALLTRLAERVEADEFDGRD